MTSIYYLLVAKDFSAFHRLDSDEIWHYIAARPKEIIRINPIKGLFFAIILSFFREGFRSKQYFCKKVNEIIRC